MSRKIEFVYEKKSQDASKVVSVVGLGANEYLVTDIESKRYEGTDPSEISTFPTNSALAKVVSDRDEAIREADKMLEKLVA